MKSVKDWNKKAQWEYNQEKPLLIISVKLRKREMEKERIMPQQSTSNEFSSINYASIPKEVNGRFIFFNLIN